jgi:hypothetical protein
MLPDGMTVRIDETTAHEPDALVYCGERLRCGDRGAGADRLPLTAGWLRRNGA